MKAGKSEQRRNFLRYGHAVDFSAKFDFERVFTCTKNIYALPHSIFVVFAVFLPPGSVIGIFIICKLIERIVRIALMIVDPNEIPVQKNQPKSCAVYFMQPFRTYLFRLGLEICMLSESGFFLSILIYFANPPPLRALHKNLPAAQTAGSYLYFFTCARSFSLLNFQSRAIGPKTQ